MGLSHADDRYLNLLIDCLTASLYDESAWQVVEGARTNKEKTLRHPLALARGLAASLAVRLLRRCGFLLVRPRPFDPAIRHEGRDWPCFGYSMAGRIRLENVRRCVEDVLERDVPGDFIETGAWRGGTCILMRAILGLYGVTNRAVWVADSFQGLPPPATADDGADLSHVQQLKVGLEQVKANFRRFGLLDDQVKFLPGWFSDTLPAAPIDRLAVLRLDGDLYSSTTDALVNLYHKVSPGGYVIVDDYYSWPECRRAVTDFCTARGIKAKVEPIDWTGMYWVVE
jgi:O-methyltransferase